MRRTVVLLCLVAIGSACRIYDPRGDGDAPAATPTPTPARAGADQLFLAVTDDPTCPQASPVLLLGLATDTGRIASSAAPVESSPAAHVAFSPYGAAGRVLYVSRYNLSDPAFADGSRNSLQSYALDVRGTPHLVGEVATPGRIVSAMIADPQGRFLYAVGGDPPEIALHPLDPGTGAAGEAIERRSVPLTSGTRTNVAFAPDGRHLYVTSDRLDNAVVIAVDPTTGGLGSIAPSGLPGIPLGFALHPNGRYFYSADFGDPGQDRRERVWMSEIDATDGTLHVRQALVDASGGVDSLVVAPSGRLLYGSDQRFGVAIDTIDPVDGRLERTPGAPFPLGPGARSLVMDAAGRFVFAVSGGAGARDETTPLIWAQPVSADAPAPGRKWQDFPYVPLGHPCPGQIAVSH